MAIEQFETNEWPHGLIKFARVTYGESGKITIHKLRGNVDLTMYYPAIQAVIRLDEKAALELIEALKLVVEE